MRDKAYNIGCSRYSHIVFYINIIVRYILFIYFVHQIQLMASFITYIPSGGIAIGVIITIIVFILYTFISTYHIYNVGYQMLGGLWEADPSFNQDAGLDRFYIFIEPPNTGNVCWIVMANDNQMIVNHMTTYKISTKWNSLDNWTTDISHPRYFNIKFSNLPNNLIDENNFPKIQTIKLDIRTGKLYLLSPDYPEKKDVYFVGYKEPRASDLIEVDKSNIITDDDKTEEFNVDNEGSDKSDNVDTGDF